jgi:hypothetical protein
MIVDARVQISSALNRSGIVLIVKAAGSHASSFQVNGAEARASVGRIDAPPQSSGLGVLVVVEKHAGRSSFHHLLVASAGARRSISRERHGGLAHLAESPPPLDA